MKFRLEKINEKMGKDIYDMYQDIPKEEIGSTNKINGCSLEEFFEVLKTYKDEEENINKELNTTTNRYILYVDNRPVGEIGIRTSLNDFWMNKGSQIYYKIRISDRNRGYGTKILELALDECKKIGMEKVRINCDDTNLASRKVVEKNGGILDIQSYKTSNGYSSSFIINLI